MNNSKQGLHFSRVADEILQIHVVMCTPALVVFIVIFADMVSHRISHLFVLVVVSVVVVAVVSGFKRCER